MSALDPANDDPIITEMKQGDAAAEDPVIQQMQDEDAASGVQASLSLGQASDQNPVAAGEDLRLAQRYHTTPDQVKAFPQAFRERMATEDARASLAQAPALRQTIANNPQIAPVVHKDVPQLAHMEKTLGQSFEDAPYELLKGFGGATMNVARSLNWGLGKLIGAVSPKAGAWWNAQMVAPADQQMQYFQPDAGARFPEKALNALGGLGGQIPYMYLTGGESEALPAGASTADVLRQVAIHGTKAMSVPAVSSAVQTGRQVYDQTGSPEQALKAAQTEYLLTTLYGMVPMGVPGRIPMRLASGAVAGAGMGEATRQIENQELPEGMQQPFDLDSFLIQGLTGSMLGAFGPRATNPRIDEAAQRNFVEATKAARAAHDLDRMEKVSEVSANTTLRNADPAAFHQMVEAMSENSDMQDLYVKGDHFAQTMATHGYDTDWLRQNMPDVSSQMKEALETDGDLRIPVADYATHLAGTPMDEDLLPNMKADPDGMTYAEAQDWEKNMGEQLMQEAAKVNDQVQGDTARQSSRDVVYNDVLRQLNDTSRFTPDVNKAYATLMTHAFDQIGAAKGQSPEEAYAQYGPKVMAEKLGAGLNQTNLDPSILDSVESYDKHFETGKPVTFAYAHNPESATKIHGKPTKDSRFGRWYEPSGKYVTIVGDRHKGDLAHLQYGDLTFENPLVLKGGDDFEWKKNLSAAFGGLRGAKLSQAVKDAGYDGIVTTQNGHVSETLDLQSFDPTKALFQGAEPDLYVAHNITAENIRHAEELGGLAAPSLAVARVGKGPFDAFGDITLLAKPDLLESAKARTFDADVYSPRHPSAEYDVNRQKFAALDEKVQQNAAENGGLEGPSIDDLERNGPKDMLYNPGLRYAWLKDQGKAPKAKKAKVDAYVKRAAALGHTRYYEFVEDPRFQKIAAKHYQDMVDAMSPEYREKAQKEFFEGNGELNKNLLNNAAHAVVNYVDSGGIDRLEMRSAVDKVFRTKAVQSAYEKYVSDTFNDLSDRAKLFKGYTASGNRSYTDYTLDNVLREMTRKLQNGEGFNYGAGSVRSAYANEMKSIRAIQARREQIIHKDAFDKIKAEAQQKLMDALDELRPYYKYDANRFGYFDDGATAIAEGPRGWRDAFNLDDHARKVINDLVEYLRGLPTEYFETKMQRAVDLSEFDTAIVPKGTSSDVIDILKNKGLQVKQYPHGDAEARAELIAKQKQLLFQGEGNRGGYSPATRTISLLQHADLSTFLHETGHFLLDTWTHIASEADAPEQVKQDTQALMKWFGVKDVDAWHNMDLEQQREFHEKFAKGFEQYLMEGKAPSLDLQPLFSRFRQWLLSIYQSLKNLGTPLTDEVRGVMDRMLASQEAIRQAQDARGYFDVIQSKPEGVSDADWNDYLNLQNQATETAIGEMQAKSLRDMKWLSGANGRAVKALNKEAAAARESVQEDAEKEVNAQPIYRAERWLRTGEMDMPDGRTIKAEKGFKLDSGQVRQMYADETRPGYAPDLAKLRGMMGPKGLDPELVAEMFDFPSGDALVRSLADAEPKEMAVDGVAQRLMLERHGELSTPDAINEAADAAIHNTVRARFMATGLKMLAKAPVPVRTLLKGAQEAADAAINAKRVGTLGRSLLRQYESGERQANKAVLQLAPKDPAAAAMKQRSALLNNQLAVAVRGAVQDVKNLIALQAKYDKKTIRAKMDPDILDQIDDLRDRFDFRKYPPEGPGKKVEQLQKWLDGQKALGYSPVEIDDLANPAVRMPYRQMTVEQARGLLATLKSMERLARERRKITIEGQQIDLDNAVSEMAAKMVERGEKFTDAQLAEHTRAHVDPMWQVTLDRLSSFFRGALAAGKPQHFKANQYDMHEILGPFRRMVFEPVVDANYRYLDMRREVSNLFREQAAKLGKPWQKSLSEVVTDHNLMDNALEEPAKRRLTRGDMIGIALHVGNESNFDKLTAGMGWKPEDVWAALDANMRESDWQAVQTLWKAADLHWDDMVRMNHDLGNTMPDKIEPRPFMTKFGRIEGGYAPVRYDPLRSKLFVRKSQDKGINPAEGLFSRRYYRADTTTNGSLNERLTGYHDFVNLDWHATQQAIHDGIRDLAYREALVNAHKIISNKVFRKQFMRSYGPEAHDALLWWLGRLANSDVMDDQTSRFAALMRTARHAVVANGIALRISTMFKHGGSAAVKSAAYFTGGGEKYYFERQMKMATNYGDQVAEALAKFPEIRARAEQQDRDFSQTLASLMEPESIRGKAERFGHSFVAHADFFTAAATAHAAYDWATTEGIPKKLGGTGKPMDEADAIHFANGMVREAHGSNVEADRANVINSRNELVKMLTMLYMFMNNSLGQHLDLIDKMKMHGFGKPEVIGRYLAAVLLPGMVAQYVAAGGPGQNESWKEWMGLAALGEYAAMIPLVREGYDYFVKGYDTAGLPPWFRALAELGKPAVDTKKAVEGKPVKHPIKDVGSAAGLILPGLGQISATAQFLYNVGKGREHPRTVQDWIRGIMSGQSKPPK